MVDREEAPLMTTTDWVEAINLLKNLEVPAMTASKSQNDLLDWISDLKSMNYRLTKQMKPFVRQSQLI